MLHSLHNLECNQAIIALGGNLQGHKDSPVGTVMSAITALTGVAGRICYRSRLYRTPAYPAGAGPDFVNAAVIIETPHSPDALLQILHEIEADFGRTRAQRWAPRTLDLDLIAFGNLTMPDAQTLRYWMAMPVAQQMTDTPTTLILPHPRMHERAFVLIPIADIAPDWRHPVLGASVREICAALDPADLAQITEIAHEL